MLMETSAKVQAAIAAGKSEEQIVAAGVGDKYKDWSWGFINEDRWLTTLYNEYK